MIVPFPLASQCFRINAFGTMYQGTRHCAPTEQFDKPTQTQYQPLYVDVNINPDKWVDLV